MINVYLMHHVLSFDPLLLIILSSRTPYSIEKHIQVSMILLSHCILQHKCVMSNTAQVIHVNHMKVSECV